MTKYVRIVLALASLLTLHARSTANADALLLRAYIPFDFTAGRTTLPPGTYYIKRLDGYRAVFELRGSSGGVFFGSDDLRYGDPADDARIVFNRYGGRYFLREVWFSGSQGYPLPETTEEREWVSTQARNGAPRRVRLIILSIGERQ